jgi:hypothetical protein
VVIQSAEVTVHRLLAFSVCLSVCRWVGQIAQLSELVSSSSSLVTPPSPSPHPPPSLLDGVDWCAVSLASERSQLTERDRRWAGLGWAGLSRQNTLVMERTGDRQRARGGAWTLSRASSQRQRQRVWSGRVKGRIRSRRGRRARLAWTQSTL